MKYSKVRDVCTIINGYAFKSKEFTDTGIPVIKIKNVKPNKILLDGLTFVSGEIAEKRSDYLIRKNDILLTMTGNRADGSPESWVGKAALFKEDGDFLLNQRVAILRPITTEVNTEYLAYYLSSWNTQLYFIKRANSSGGQANISPTIVGDYEIAIPELSVQMKIANILQLLDDKIRNNERINKNLEQQAQELFKSWFVNFEPFGGKVPQSWAVAKLGDIASIKTNSFYPTKNPDAVLEHYSIPAYDEQKYPVFESAANVKSNKYILTTNSVMISKLNPETKRVWRPMCLSEFAVSSTEFIIFEANTPVYRDFIFSIIDSAAFSDWMCAHTTGSTNSRQRTTPGTTLEFQFALPDDKIITNFCKIVTPMYNMIAQNTCESRKLAALRDSLLPKLMSGEIDVSDLDL